MKPLIKWLGGKQILAPLLPFPNDIKGYVEPFLGGAAMFLHHCKDFKEGMPILLSDCNKPLIDFYKCLKSYPRPVYEGSAFLFKKMALASPMQRKSIYYRARVVFNDLKKEGKNPFKQASLFLFLNKTCFNGLYRENSTGELNSPFGNRIGPQTDYDMFTGISEELKKACLIQTDFRNTLEYVKSGFFVYCDPPYRPISRTSSFTSYNSEKFDDVDQTRLAEYAFKCVKKGAKVLITNSYSEENLRYFKRLYKGFDFRLVPSRHSVSASAGARKSLYELCIFKNIEVDGKSDLRMPESC